MKKVVIQKLLADAIITKKNLKKKEEDKILIPKIGLIKTCENVIRLCVALLENDVE